MDRTQAAAKGPRASEPAVRISDLTVDYGGVVAVDRLNLDVAPGEMLVLLGPSGCGKTTTMRCIAGLETPASGSIDIGGIRVFDSATGRVSPPNRRDVGMVFQSYAIWPHKTVFENVAFPLRMKRLGRAQVHQQVEDMLRLVGLEGLGPRNAGRLSGGQMQRVALARSLVMRPKVLLLDEPLSNLDAKLRERLRFELKEIQQKLKVTTVYVTHDQLEALALADRIAVMNNGRLVQVDTPMGIYERPAHTFVADFMGYTNIWSATVTARTGSGARLRLATGDLTVVSARCASEVGDTVSLCLRPEAVAVLEERSPDATNAWDGEVAVASYLGSQVRYRIKVSAGIVVEAVTFTPDKVLPAGSPVSVSFAPDAVTVLSA